MDIWKKHLADGDNCVELRGLLQIQNGYINGSFFFKFWSCKVLSNFVKKLIKHKACKYTDVKIQNKKHMAVTSYQGNSESLFYMFLDQQQTSGDPCQFFGLIHIWVRWVSLLESTISSLSFAVIFPFLAYVILTESNDSWHCANSPWQPVFLHFVQTQLSLHGSANQKLWSSFRFKSSSSNKQKKSAGITRYWLWYLVNLWDWRVCVLIHLRPEKIKFKKF